MNRNFFFLVFFQLFATVTFADDVPWNEKTRDAAYEAPSSMFQKKWYNSHDEETIVFFAKGTFTITSESQSNNGVRFKMTYNGSYTRNKDKLTLLYSSVKITPNSTDLAKLSARMRDSYISRLKQIENVGKSELRNKKDYYLMLRLDEKCFIYTRYDPKTKIFNDYNWNTWYSESYMKEISQKKSEKQNDASVQNEGENPIFDEVEQMPSFDGGNEKLMEYITNNLQYPSTAKDNGIQGRVNITFVVEQDGSLSNVKVGTSVDPALDKEAVRLVESMPKWIPGKKNGETVRVRYNIPISFR